MNVSPEQLLNDIAMVTEKDYVFESSKGGLIIYDLWTIPLTGKNSLNLVAQKLNKKLQEQSTETVDFVTGSTGGRNALDVAAFNVVLWVIETRKARVEKEMSQAVRRTERKKLEEVLARKETADLENLSADDLRARIAELS